MTDEIFFLGSDDGYFTGILLRRCRIELVQNNIVNYPTTEMGRNLLMAEVSFQLCYFTGQCMQYVFFYMLHIMALVLSWAIW